MLKGIDSLLTPDLLWALAAMGHGDTIAIVDANYPAYALHSRVLPLAGSTMAEATSAIAKVMPVDQTTQPAVFAMTPDGQPESSFTSHQSFARTLTESEGRDIQVAPLERTHFYARARDAFAVVLTGETSSFACFILTKGVVAGTEAPNPREDSP